MFCNINIMPVFPVRAMRTIIPRVSKEGALKFLPLSPEPCRFAAWSPNIVSVSNFWSPRALFMWPGVLEPCFLKVRDLEP